MKANLRQQLLTVAQSGLEGYPADARRALALGMRRYRRRIRVTYIGMVAAALVSTGLVFAGHQLVWKPTLTSIVVRSDSTVLQLKASLQLIAEGTFGDKTPVPMTTDIVWTSSRSEVATVDNAGKLAGLLPGTTTVTASQGEIRGSIDITVSNAKLTGIAITPNASKVEVGKQLSLTAKGVYDDESTATLTSPPVVWKSSNVEVVTVDATGLAAGARPGTATITAALEGVQTDLTLEVTPAPSSSRPPPPPPPTTSKVPFVEIPSGAYIGRNFNEVVSELSGLGVSPKAVAEPSATVAKDLVIKLEPVGNLPMRTLIIVTYSSGPTPEPPMINCVGVAYNVCRSKLLGMGLQVQGIPTISGEPLGTVVSQDTPPGRPIDPTKTVKLGYSIGPTPTPTPTPSK